MNLIRYLLIVFAIVVIIQVVRRLLQAPRARQKPNMEYQGKMVRCEHCGLHIPEDQAIQADNNYYCSKEHSELGRRG